MQKKWLKIQELFSMTPNQSKPTFQHQANICSSLRHLGLEDFLAKGVIEHGGGGDPEKVIWETDLQGKAECLKDLILSDPERAKWIRDEIESIAARINQETIRLLGSLDPEDLKQGRILQEIGGPPDDSFIFVVGDRPVITGWGLRPDDVGKVEDVVWPMGRAVVDSPEPGRMPGNGQPDGPTGQPVKSPLTETTSQGPGPQLSEKNDEKGSKGKTHDDKGKLLKTFLIILGILLLILLLWLALQQCSKTPKPASPQPHGGPVNPVTPGTPLENPPYKPNDLSPETWRDPFQRGKPIQLADGTRIVDPFGRTVVNRDGTVVILGDGIAIPVANKTRLYTIDGRPVILEDGKPVLVPSRPVPGQPRLIRVKVLESARIELSVDPPDPNAKWRIIVDEGAPQEVRLNISKFVEFYEPQVGPEALGSTVKLRLLPLSGGRSFKATVVAVDPSGQETIHQITVGGM